jgi:trk system potassium uptake protein TrkH
VNLRAVLSFTGLLLYVGAALLLLPAALALLDGSQRAQLAYGATFALTAAVATGMRLVGRTPATLHRKDALGVVTLTWVLLCGAGALPMWLEGAIPSPSAALFESVSGFTTTGATVVADVDGLSRATNLWRCLTHWVGGMGIVVLFVAVFPQLGVGGKQLFRAEVPGLPSEGLRPRIRETALRLWWIYSALTALCAALLWLEGMGLYDSVCHAMSALGSGGFSTRTASIGAWDSPAIHWTLIVFMGLAALNFGLYYGLLHGRLSEVIRNAELRFFLLLNLLLTGLVAASLVPERGLGEATLREAAFQVLATTSTTGFMTADFDSYPELARGLLLLAMFVGGCAGSTAGGLKAARVLLLAKVALRAVRLAAVPHGVYAVRMGHVPVPEPVLAGVMLFAVTWLGLFALAWLLLVACGLDLLSAASAVVACLSSVGPGLGSVGPAQNYGTVSPAGQLVLCGCMLAGRLEIFALLAIFTPEVWRR